MWVGEMKLWDPVSSSGVPDLRGAFVACGNTRPPAREEVYGLLERGKPSDGAFNRHTGAGFVRAVDGQYARAVKREGVDLQMLGFETFGGFMPETVAAIRVLAEERRNKLNHSEYDLTTWAARTWTSYMCQKVSVALHRAIALEIVTACGLSAAVDPRD